MAFLRDDTRSLLRQLLDADTAATPPEAGERLRGIRQLQAALDTEPAVLDAVREALAAGTGWDEIADSAGLKPAAAKWRWQGSDAEIAARHAAGRKRSERPSSKPRELPGLSVADAAKKLGVSPQAVYLRVTRGQLRAETVTLPDGRSYKRVFPDDA